MQESNPNLWPVPREELEVLVRQAKRLPTYKDAAPWLELMERDFRGVYNPEAFAMIDSVERHFIEQDRQQLKEEISQQVNRAFNEHFRQDGFELSDESVAAAIYATTKYMRNKADWGGLYRILVDYCKWPMAYKDFEIRQQKLNLKLSQKIAFDYQSLVKGFGRNWPKTYRGWQTYDTSDDPTLDHRRRVATKFLENLKEQGLQKITNGQ